jgi:predicted ArsR family transcriptional regulator
MSPERIPEEVVRFLERHIYSVTQLETLFLLRGSSHAWSAEDVARELRSNTETAKRHLRDLCDAELISCDEQRDKVYHFNTESEAIALIDLLRDLYQSHKNRLIDMIYSEKFENLQQFADAFKVKKGK